MLKNAYIEKFLENMVENKYSSKSISTYRYSLKKFTSFLDENENLTLQDVTLELLEEYRLYLKRVGLTPESITSYLQSVRRLFAFLESNGIIFSNPADGFINPAGKRGLKEVPTVEEMELLLSGINITTSIGIRDRAMIELAYCCALRMNEILKLTIFSADFDNKTIRLICKGNRERVLPMGTQSQKWLREYMTKSRPKLCKDSTSEVLWLSREGKPLIEITYQKMLQTHAQNVGLRGKITGHTMRRACATHMLKNGAHPVAIQHMLGHGCLKHLSQYLKLSITDLQKAHAKTTLGR